MREFAGPRQPVMARKGGRLLPDLTWRVVTVWYRDAKVWSTFYKASLIGNLGEPLLYLVAMGWGLGRMVGTVDGVPYIQFLAPGLVCSAAMYSATFECTFGAFTRMTRQKTYDAIMATPVALDEIVAGEVLWGATKGFLSGGSMLLVMALFGLVHSPWAVLALGLSFLIGLLFAALSMIVTAKSPSYDFFSYYFTLAIAPMFLFSGIFFPIGNLPHWARTVSWFLPLSHGVDASRSLFSGRVGWELTGELAWLAVFSLVAFSFAVRGVRKRLVQ
ncbi:MAG: ABC transporter permease [bacterium]|nr:ABC transporter permease [bacterium]MDT8396692.1 ABC transporter permease [bacterium]